MRFSEISLAALVAASMGAEPAIADSHGNDLVHSRELGGMVFMMNQAHMSLYTYDKDGDGVSNCYGQCAENWPPAILPAGSQLGENYSLIPRDDGSMQIAYKGRPLYLYAGDRKIGDIKGDGIGGVWKLSKPLP